MMHKVRINAKNLCVTHQQLFYSFPSKLQKLTPKCQPAPKFTSEIRRGSQGFEVSAQGRGCTGMSAFYCAPKPDDCMVALIRLGFSRWITFLDTSDVYGLFYQRNPYREGGKTEIRGDTAYVRAAYEASLKRLDVECLDLYHQHRIHSTVPTEITMGEPKKLVGKRKIKYSGLSEAESPIELSEEATLFIS